VTFEDLCRLRVHSGDYRDVADRMPISGAAHPASVRPAFIASRGSPPNLADHRAHLDVQALLHTQPELGTVWSGLREIAPAMDQMPAAVGGHRLPDVVLPSARPNAGRSVLANNRAAVDDDVAARQEPITGEVQDEDGQLGWIAGSAEWHLGSDLVAVDLGTYPRRIYTR
jgi:hypothetical protein